MKLETGDRVKLISRRWGSESANPVWNDYHIEGIITNDKRDGLVYEVKWDNGKSNDYYDRDLELVRYFTFPIVPLEILDTFNSI